MSKIALKKAAPKPAFEVANGDYIAAMKSLGIGNLKPGADYSRKVPGQFEAVFIDHMLNEIHVPAAQLPALAAQATGSLKALLESGARAVTACEAAVAAKKERENVANQVLDARQKRIAKAVAEERFTDIHGNEYPEPKRLG